MAWWPHRSMWLVSVGLSACAFELADPARDASIGGSSGGGAAGNAGGSGAAAAADASSGAGGTPQCPPNQHACAGKCEGNSPETGCLQSTTCDPCYEPSDATSFCTPEGLCDFACDPGHSFVNGECVCTEECCWNGDCICMPGKCGADFKCYPTSAAPSPAQNNCDELNECNACCQLFLDNPGACTGDWCHCG